MEAHPLSTVKWFQILPMCRNIKTPFRFEPPVTDDEIRAESLNL